MSDNFENEHLQREFLDLLHTRQGHFKLESGHHGNLWLDLDLLFLRPRVLQKFVIELARQISYFDIDTICGPLVGGALIAQDIATEMGVEFFYTERIAPPKSDAFYSVGYRLPSQFRKIADSKKVAIVDDVINAGSAVRGTLSELQSLGATPVVIGTFLVLGETGLVYFAERNLPLRSISYLPNEIWMPEKCPLCAAKIPLDNQS